MAASVEHFPNIPVIPYTPNAPVSNVLCFRHYDANAVIQGRTMQDWLRFAVCYWHTFRGTGADPFGGATIVRKWDGDGAHTIENFKRKMDAAFEFFHKLGVKYWTFHDRDIAPEGKTKEETEKNLDIMVDYALELQKKYSIKLLWGTANLFSAAKYMCGAATNPDLRVFAEAAAQVKKAMDVTLKLGGENYVLWGGREGFQSLLNTDVKEELDQFAAFLKMVADYKKHIGAKFQLLIEPKPKEPTAHQYDYDAQTVIGFLKTYGLDADYKLNIEPNHTTLAGHEFCHDIVFSSKYNFLGSVDANTGSPNLGWDTDQFCTDVRNTALIMLTIIQQGGLAPGGLNFDAKVRRESTEDEDMFIAHISSMDAFARGLKIAAKIIEDGVYQKLLDNRYSTWKGELGQKILKNQTTLQDVAQWADSQPECERKSGKQETFEAIYAAYLNMNL